MKCCPVPYQIKDPVDVPEKSLWLYTLWKYIFCFTLKPYFYLRFSHVMFQYSRWVCHKYLWKTTLIFREHVGRMVNLHCLPSYPIILLSMSEWLFLTSCADLCFPDTTWSKKSPTHTWVRRSRESVQKPLFGGWCTFICSMWAAHSVLSLQSIGLHLAMCSLTF